MNNATQIGVKIYNGNKGVITFFGDTLKQCNFNLAPYIKMFGKGTKLYLNQLEGNPNKGYLIQKNNTIQFGGKELCDSMKKYQGKFFLMHDDSMHSYYIDTVESKIADEAPKKSRKAKFVNPLQSAKDNLQEIVELKKAKGTLTDVMENPDTKKLKVKTADDIVISTLRTLSDECIDADDLAGAKALLKAIRKFEGMR